MHEPNASDRPETHYRFGAFAVDLRSGELSHEGRRSRLPDKPLQVLTALLERAGEVVTRQELRERMWSADTFVDFDNNLNAAVRKLREALGDSAERPQFVETIPRRGYRFIAPVTTTSGTSASSSAATTAPGAPLAARRIPRSWLGVVVAVTLVVVAGIVWQSPLSTPPTPSRSTQPDPGDRRMLAVMPFVDLDHRPDRAFFVDGLTEEMITQLGRLQPERLGVIARTSSMQYRDTAKTVDVIGSELGVQYVLEGSVRSFGDHVRITSQLIQASDQTHLWAETYDIEWDDLLQVQADVAVRVAGELALELLPDEPLARARAGTRVTAAYDAFLRGRFEWNTFSGERYPAAIAHFRDAIALDESYASAWAALADTYNLQSFTSKNGPTDAYDQARAAARRALELDPDSAMAHNALAFVLLYSDYDLTGADREFGRAIELSPNYAMAYHWWAGALSALGRHDEALDAIRHAVALDPVSLSVLSDLGWYYLFADRYDEGIDECRRILERQEYGWARACVYHGLIAADRPDQALAEIADEWPGIEEELAGQDAAAIVAELGRRKAEQRLSASDDLERYPLSAVFDLIAAGDHDRAFLWLDKALAIRDQWLVFLEVDPRFDPLATDPRYDDLARRIGLR